MSSAPYSHRTVVGPALGTVVQGLAPGCGDVAGPALRAAVWAKSTQDLQLEN